MAGSGRQYGLVAALVDQTQAQARYVITAEALRALPLSQAARLSAVERLVRGGRLAKIGHRRGLWLIVPPEYRLRGVPPVDWVLHDIFGALQVQYYVGLRSAALQYGATHHALMAWHIVVDRRVAPMVIGRTPIRILHRPDFAVVPARELPNRPTRLRCSTPVATALDLIRYLAWGGGVHTVAGTVAQMADALAADDISAVLEAMADVPNTQRLGYLLQRTGQDAVAAECLRWLESRPRRAVPLEHGHGAAPASGPLDATWKVLVNAVPDATL